MSDERERLFRDDGGAAVERAARLEDENRRLRAEVERLSRSPRPEPELLTTMATPRRSDDRIIASVVLGMVTLFAGATLAARPHHACSGARAAVTVRGTPGVAIAAPTPVVVNESRDSCDPPMWTDDLGIRRLKPECVAKIAPTPKPVATTVRADECSPPYTVGADGFRRYKAACL